MAVITGSVDRIVFRNSESGFCVARFRLTEQRPKSTKGDAIATIVGTLPTARPGEMLRLTGEWRIHAVHGRNFQVEHFEAELPDTVEGIERYLSSGVIRGVGPVTAARIVESFGVDAIAVIDQNPEELRSVTGITPKRLDVIRASWQEHKRIRDLMMFLQKCEVSVGLASRIYAHYGDEAVQIIERDPYQLAHEVRGVGFKTADALAASIGISKRSASRYVAGLRYVLSQATEQGHVFLPRSDVLKRGSTLLGAASEELEPALLELLRRGDAILEDQDVYLSPFHKAETGADRILRRLQSTPSVLTLNYRQDVKSAVLQAEQRQGLSLVEEQRLAIEQALSEKVSITTGGPGTGKTSTLLTLIGTLEQQDVTYCLAAPTGRAAKRVSEACGRRASTIHRLLEYQPKADIYVYDHARPLPFEFVIVDEASMLDILLFYHLLKAIPSESHLVLVGDADQLPSVGPGNVLRDLLRGESIPSVQLKQVFRQAAGSQIVTVAHQINRGVVPQIGNGRQDEVYFLRQSDEDRVVEDIKELVSRRLPAAFGLHPTRDIQVISPMHGGKAGVANLNEELQRALNPGGSGRSEMERGARAFRKGDKVMQVRNNYDKDVYNGDLGLVRAIHLDEQQVDVAYPTLSGSRVVSYDASDLDELSLAYATSVHKAQGSEFPCIVMPLVTGHYMLLQRNLLYTAVTRAKRLCVLIGSQRALQVAIDTCRNDSRNTHLSDRLARKTVGAVQLGLN